MSDLSITQVMQEDIPEEHRGSVFGVESALCLLFSVGKDILAILLPDPRTFGFLIIISVSCVFAGFVMYVYYCLRSSSRSPSQLKTIYSAPLNDEIEKL